MTSRTIHTKSDILSDLSGCLSQDESVIWTSHADNHNYMPKHSDYILIRVLALGIFFVFMLAVTTQHNGASISTWDPITIGLWIAFILIMLVFARQISSVMGTSINVLYGITNRRILAFDPVSRKIVGDIQNGSIRSIRVQFLGAETNFVFHARSSNEASFSLTFINLKNADEIAQTLHESTGIKPVFPNPKK